MKDKLKQHDNLLIQLLGAPREDAARLRKTDEARRRSIETRGRERIAAMKASLPENITGLLEKAGSAYCNHPNWPVTGVSKRMEPQAHSRRAPKQLVAQDKN